MYQKLGHEYHLFSHLNFLGASILNFYEAIQLPLLLRISVLLYMTMEQQKQQQILFTLTVNAYNKDFKIRLL